MTCWCSLAAWSLLYCCALRFLVLDSVDLRYRRPGVGVQCCQVVPHHAGAVLRPHLQTLRLPEGQPLPPRAAAKSENWNTASHYKLAALTAASQSGCLIFFISIMFLRKMSVRPGKHGQPDSKQHLHFCVIRLMLVTLTVLPVTFCLLVARQEAGVRSRLCGLGSGFWFCGICSALPSTKSQ